MSTARVLAFCALLVTGCSDLKSGASLDGSVVPGDDDADAGEASRDAGEENRDAAEESRDASESDAGEERDAAEESRDASESDAAPNEDHEPPAIDSADTTTFTVGTAGSFTIRATGTPTPAIAVQGTLPQGVSLEHHADGTYELSGTPSAGQGGVYPLTLHASNGVAPDASQPFTLTVVQAPAFSSAASTTFHVGMPGSFQVTGTGYPADFTVTTTGATLPAGVTLTAQGLLSGTPAAMSGGTYALELLLSNGVDPAGSQSFTLTVEEVPTFTSAAAATFRVGTPGTALVTTTGYPEVSSLQVSSALPSGLTLTDNNDGTATLAGTPAVGTGGVHSLTIIAGNGLGPDAQQSFTLTIEEAPAFTSTAAVVFLEGQLGTFTLTASGHPAPTFTSTGAGLPAGITLGSDGVLSGSATASGTFQLTFTASNGVSPDAVQSFVLTVEVPKVGITGVSPNPMIPGRLATLTGQLFAPSSNTVTVNGVNAEVTSVVDANSIVIRVPCLPSGTVAVAATNATGTSTAFNASLQASVHALAVGETLAPANAADSECIELSPTNAPVRYLVSVFSVETSPSSNAPYVFSGAAPQGLLAADSLNAPDTLRPFTAADTEGREALPAPSGSDVPELDPDSLVPPLHLGSHPTDPEIELAEAADAEAQHAELLETNARAFEELAREFVADPRMQQKPPDVVAFDVVAPPATRAFRLPTPTASAICTTFQLLNATRVYHSGKFAIYEDVETPDAFKASLNPAMQTYYTRIGDQFNADMEPILRTNFGDPLLRDAVTDNNGVVIMLTSPKVNSFSGVSGYTTTCDQYPNDEGAGATNTSSNFGEIFYAYQPTVSGAGYTGNTLDNWYRTIRASLVHEVKHIVSFASRVANGAAQYESGWLEEGTARLAEELWARQAVDVLPWKGNNPYGSAANPVGVYCDLRPSGYPECDDNTRRPATIMQRHFTSLYTNMFGSNMRLLSPFGATASDNASYYYAGAWSLVRYALDRYGSDESAFLRQLTSATSTGVTNLLAAAGNPDLTEVVGGWVMSFASDDYPGFTSAPSSSQQPTWNFRNIYAGLNSDLPATYTLAYPLQPTGLSFGAFNAPAITTLRGGGALFYSLSGTQTAAQTLWLRTSGDKAPNDSLRIRVLRVE